MKNDEIIENSYKGLDLRNIKIRKIEKIDNYLFVVLDNDKKLLMNRNEIYDISDYEHLREVFQMGDKLCAVLNKCFIEYVVDLKNMEVLFEDRNAYSISKYDDRTLYVIMTVGAGESAIYDIETKKYLLTPENYELETSLGNELYVFCQKDDPDKNFYEHKRCVINIDGKTLLENVEGWIYLSGNHLIIVKKDELNVVGINEETHIDIKTIKKNETVIAKPRYYKGNILIIEKNGIKIFNPLLVLLKEIKVENLEEVLDFELVGDVLKLSLSNIIDKEINRHVFVNLESGKLISHVHIDGYPYWKPTTFIGQDSVDSEMIDYHFYDRDFNFITDVIANSCWCVDSNKECMFFIKKQNNNEIKKQLLNTEKRSIKEVDYDIIRFHNSLPYGYGINYTKERMDFFDENLEIIISNFDYKKYRLNFDMYEFNYFIVNGYICIINRVKNTNGVLQYQTIIQNTKGEIILDSLEHQCYAIGNLIQIISEEQSEFLNTITGEMGSLQLSLPLDANGKIDLEKLNNFNDSFKIENNSNLMLELPQKTKRLEHNIKNDTK